MTLPTSFLSSRRPRISAAIANGSSARPAVTAAAFSMAARFFAAGAATA